MVPTRVFPLAALAALAACSATDAGPSERSFQERRATFESALTRLRPSPGAADTLLHIGPVLGEHLPGELEPVRYPAPLGSNQAWLFTPEDATERSAPALLFLHGASSLIPLAEYVSLRRFMDAGYVVMWPTYRGEPGNPGHYEWALGEVDDAEAAVRWLAQHPLVDPGRVYVLGWSAGGGLSAMLSLRDLPVRHTASSGGLYHVDQLRADRGGEGPPFDTTVVEELEMRTLPGNFHWMKLRHYAYIETQVQTWVPSITAANRARERGDTLIEVIMVPGDHYSAFPEAVRRYFELIESEAR